MMKFEYNGHMYKLNTLYNSHLSTYIELSTAIYTKSIRNTRKNNNTITSRCVRVT